MASGSNPEAKRKAYFTENLGGTAYHAGWEALSTHSPELFRASVNLSAVPVRKKHLDEKTQALIGLAVDSASTHLYVDGIRNHINAALDASASEHEVVEVIELTSTLGIHACNIGVPLLAEVMREEGLYEQHATAGRPLDARREALKEQFTVNRGYWHSFWQDFLELDAEFFEGYLEFSSVPWLKDVDGSGKSGGALSAKVGTTRIVRTNIPLTHLRA